MPGGDDLLENPQIAGRTSPSLLDLLAALATGLAGAVALSRRDVAAVLPGVAIAISLVPPLAVVGICFGEGDFESGVGAIVLFLSNIFALMLAGVLMFGLLGYTTEAVRDRRGNKRPYVVLTVLMVLVSVPLAANSAATYVLDYWGNQIKEETGRWLEGSPGSEVTGIEHRLGTFRVDIRQVAPLPDEEDLRERLREVLPDTLEIVLETTSGREIEIGDLRGG